MAKVFFAIILMILSFYVGNNVGEAWNSVEDLNTKLECVNVAFDNIFQMKNIHISLTIKDFLCGLGGSFICGLVFLYMATMRHNFRTGEEHGSARWGTANDIKKYIDKDYSNNMLFTQTERMSINTRKTMRNNNVLVVGGSGSGKTRFFLKPNLMQMHSSYVITDPKGSVLLECGKMLQDNGYKIKVINTIDFEQSMHYNPFRYIKEEKDILKLADLIIKNLGDKSEKQDFWVKAEKLLYQALIGFIFYELKQHPEEQNFNSFMLLLNSMEVKEEDENFVDAIDMMFLELEEKNPEHFAVKQYKKYKMAAGKTAKSILISCATRLAAFDINSVAELMKYDEMELEKVGDEKTALFIIIDDSSATYNFIASFLYTQLFNTLCNRADTVYANRGSRLPVHVRCLLDEFANIGQIPDFEKLIATIRSREISASIIVQNMAQIKALYDKQAGTIVGNCDTMLFLGSNEEETMKNISAKVGKTTIDHKGSSTSKGQNGQFTISDQIIARDLITSEEVGMLDNSECLLFIRGVRPFKSKKFNISGHENYKLLADSNNANRFSVKNYIEQQKNKSNSNQDIVQDDNFILEKTMS